MFLDQKFKSEDMGNCTSAPEIQEAEGKQAFQEPSGSYTNALALIREEIAPLYNTGSDPSSQAELQQRRKEFFGTRVEGSKEMWAALRSVSEAEDPAFGDTVLQTAGLSPYKLDAEQKLVYTYDQSGFRYEFPVFVLYAPGDLPLHSKRPVRKSAVARKKMVTLRSRFSDTSKDSSYRISSAKHISDLLDAIQNDTKLDKSKLHCVQLGRVFKDNDFISDLNEQAVVQIFVDNKGQAWVLAFVNLFRSNLFWCFIRSVFILFEHVLVGFTNKCKDELPYIIQLG